GRDEAAPAALAALVVDGLGMRVVDPRDQDGDVRLIAKRRRRTDDRHPLGKARLPDFRHLFRYGAEDQVERLREELLIVEAREREHRGVGTALGEPAAGTARLAEGIAEGFSGGTLGGADRGDGEPGVQLERGEYLLAGEAGGSQYAYTHTPPP